MINKINNFDDVDFVILDFMDAGAAVLMGLSVLMMMACLVSYALSRIKKMDATSIKFLLDFSRAASISGVFLVFLTGMMLSSVNSRKPVTADQLMKLAEAESTLLQLKAASTVMKEPQVVDSELSQKWINSMRKQVASGLNLGEYRILVKEFNALNIGEPKVHQWFKDNSSEAVYDEIKANLMQAVSQSSKNTQARPLGQIPVEAANLQLPAGAVQVEQSQMDQGQNAMEAQLEQVLN